MPDDEPPNEDLPDLPDEVRLKVQGKVIAAVMEAPYSASVNWPGLLGAIATRMQEWAVGEHLSMSVYDWTRKASNHDVTAMCGLAAVTLTHIKRDWQAIADEFEELGARMLGTVVARFATGVALDATEAVVVYGHVRRAGMHDRLILVDVFAASLLAIHFPADEFRVLR